MIRPVSKTLLRTVLAAAAIGWAGPTAHAASLLTNGDFEAVDGAGNPDPTPWDADFTPNGTAADLDFVPFDVNNDGLTTTAAGIFNLGQVDGAGDPGGVFLFQPVTLPAGDFRFRADIASQFLPDNPQDAASNGDAGTFALIVDGNQVGDAVSLGTILANQTLFGQLNGSFSLAAPATIDVGIRVTREFLALPGDLGEFAHYIDDVKLTLIPTPGAAGAGLALLGMLGTRRLGRGEPTA